ncbi:8948_t:CDS:1, partial [Ambispora leptoticha]
RYHPIFANKLSIPRHLHLTLHNHRHEKDVYMIFLLLYIIAFILYCNLQAIENNNNNDEKVNNINVTLNEY